MKVLACRGTKNCLVKSLKASKRGWTRPIKETLLGPKRLWNNAITLRSNNVKKATDKRIKIECTAQQINIIYKEYPIKIISVLKTNVFIKLILLLVLQDMNENRRGGVAMDIELSNTLEITRYHKRIRNKKYNN